MISCGISQVTSLFNLPIAFFFHSIIFFCGLNIAIYGKTIPRWATTSLWYIGLSSLGAAITIVIEWNLTNAHPLSYTNFGYTGHLMACGILAVTLTLLFFKSLRKNSDDEIMKSLESSDK